MNDTTEQIRVVISLRMAAEPIEGRLIEPLGLAGPFRGWLALASLIEAARSNVEHEFTGAELAPEHRGPSPM